MLCERVSVADRAGDGLRNGILARADDADYLELFCIIEHHFHLDVVFSYVLPNAAFCVVFIVISGIKNLNYKRNYI